MRKDKKIGGQIDFTFCHQPTDFNNSCNSSPCQQ